MGATAGQLAGGIIALVVGCGLGCQGGTRQSSQGSGAQSSSSGAQSSTSGGNSGTTSGIAGTSTGAGTGGVPTLVDGGYVFCSAVDHTDAGVGPVSWMCPPGTYFCGEPGSCSQCLSDADCANQALPTFDSKRQRCDLDSGIAGYQGFCQQCLDNPDCQASGLPPGEACNLDPLETVASIDALGFENCAILGPGCVFGLQPAIGGCASDTCETDGDCASALFPTQTPSRPTQQPAPYCLQGHCSNTSDPDYCPNCSCTAASTCPGPVVMDSGLFCDTASARCICTSSAQCGGFWPVCEMVDGGEVLDGGASPGTCGCDRDDQCGDGGLKCLVLPRTVSSSAGPACALACDDPRFPACAAVDSQTPICDVDSALCIPCDGPAGAAGDSQCQTQADQDFVGPLCRLDGVCGCRGDTDCREGDVCQGPYQQSSTGLSLGICAPPPLPCTPRSGAFCDWDSGVSGPACLTDYQCRSARNPQEFCVADAGACVECRNDTDCAAFGLAESKGFSLCTLGKCSSGCASDQDCGGNPAGQHCDTDAGDTFFHSCICLTDSECQAADSCRPLPGETLGRCAGGCTMDADCPSDFFCDLYATCRPRCDPGHACQPPDLICDRDDTVGLNGFGASGSVPGGVWCYGCVETSDCNGGLGCGRGTGFACGPCGSDSDCLAGEICGATTDGRCHAPCDGGLCPPGEVCDVPGSAGNGANVCYECLSAADCAPGQGCNSGTHTCGSCLGPTAYGGPFDCPPDAVCSNYWLLSPVSGVCLQNCDRLPCPAGKSCGVFPSLTPDHRYCFGCRQDSDCADAGAGAWCDTSVGLTFTCQPALVP